MPLVPPYPCKERKLFYGSSGVGKSFAYLCICRALAQYGSPAMFHVISTDNGLARLLYSEFPDLIQLVRIHTVYEWREYVAALAVCRKECRPDDWIVMDLACKAWDAVQEEFTDQVFGKDLDQYFLDVRKAFEKARGDKKQGAPPLDGRQDWPIMKKMFKNLSDDLLLKQKCHVICCNSSSPIDSKIDSAEIVNEFGRIGAKPSGPKKWHHDFETCLYFSRRDGAFHVRTHKDRSRRYMDERFENFAYHYLIGTAGWQVTQ